MTGDEIRGSAEHWDAAYSAGDLGRSWYQPHAAVSARLITGATGVDAGIVDVGGGASTLVDDLVDAGYWDLTVLDLSEGGIRIAQSRLGPRAAAVTWITADLRGWVPSRTYDVWHDRAVLHFLTDAGDRAAYRRSLLEGTLPGSVAVIGVFGPDGPTMCSGLRVQRYGADGMAGFLGTEFVVEESFLSPHRTPSGGEQSFLWTMARRVA